MKRSRGLVAIILSFVAGLSIVALTFAALIDVLADPTQSTLSPQYAALVQTTLGVLVGGLVGFMGGSQVGRADDETDHNGRTTEDE